MSDIEITIRGETLLLMAERCALWRERQMLLVADPHFGKAAAFRAGGIPVPSGTTTDTVARLRHAVSRTGATCISFLGDFLHARSGRSDETLQALDEWRSASPSVGLTLVRGNHDRHAGDPPRELEIECVDAPYALHPFVLAHHPSPSDDGYVLAGHVHPGVRLYGRGGQRERLPCFVFGPDYAVMPAFGEFTGLADVDPDASADVYAVADGEVIRIR
jgi:DNA ligase-associated metallophosphoesterase